MDAMPIVPRPVSPKSACADLWSYLVESRAHKWPLLGISGALTWLIVWAFIVDGNTNTTPRQNQIIYVENWNANRPDSQIIMRQKLELAQREVKLQESQKRMQKMADMFGIEWREEEVRKTAERQQALKQINARLDKRISDAERRESGNRSTTTPARP